MWARVGNRAVEVIRVELDDWMTFATIDDRVCRGGDRRNVSSRAEAMSWARGFLAGDITPETWPNCVEHIPPAERRT